MTAIPKLHAVFFRTRAGKEPVREWLLELDKGDRKTIGTDIAYVQFKWPLGRPRVSHLRDEIWEVRSSLPNRISRVLFAVMEGEMVLLHGFIKKTQRTPKEDIDLAATRCKEWKHG